jgi:hypothetical protein
VTTNDPKHEKMEIHVTGEIKRFATITPKAVFLTGIVGEKIAQTVKIVPETEKPFKLVKVTALYGTDIRYSEKDAEISGKKMYELTVENTRKIEGRYSDRITIITDESNYTPLTIMVRGNIKAEAKAQPAAEAQPEPSEVKTQPQTQKKVEPQASPGAGKTGE